MVPFKQTIAEGGEPTARGTVALFCLNPIVAGILFRFLLQQNFDVPVFLDLDVEYREAQPEGSIVIASVKTFEWMLAIDSEQGGAIEAWVVEPFASILAFLNDMEEPSNLDCRYADVFRTRVPRARWVRLPDICMSRQQLALWLTKLLPIAEVSSAPIVTEEARRLLAARLTTVPPGIADARLRRGRIYRVQHGRVGCLFLGPGWYPPEIEHAWMLGARARIALPLPSPASKHPICRMQLQQLAATNYVRVLVNGVEALGFSINADTPPFRYIDVPLPSSPTKPGVPTIIEFICSRAWKPCDLDETLIDGRSIGVGLRSIELVDGFDEATAASQQGCVWQIAIGESSSVPTSEPPIMGLITAGCADTFKASQVPGFEQKTCERPLSLFILADATTPFVLPALASLPANSTIFRGDLPGLAGLWPSMAHAPSFLRTETFEQAIACLDAIDADLATGVGIVQILTPGIEPDEPQRQWIADRFSRASYSPTDGWTLVHQ